MKINDDKLQNILESFDVKTQADWEVSTINKLIEVSTDSVTKLSFKEYMANILTFTSTLMKRNYYFVLVIVILFALLIYSLDYRDVNKQSNIKTNPTYLTEKERNELLFAVLGNNDIYYLNDEDLSNQPKADPINFDNPNYNYKHSHISWEDTELFNKCNVYEPAIKNTQNFYAGITNPFISSIDVYEYNNDTNIKLNAILGNTGKKVAFNYIFKETTEKTDHVTTLTTETLEYQGGLFATKYESKSMYWEEVPNFIDDYDEHFMETLNIYWHKDDLKIYKDNDNNYVVEYYVKGDCKNGFNTAMLFGGMSSSSYAPDKIYYSIKIDSETYQFINIKTYLDTIKNENLIRTIDYTHEFKDINFEEVDELFNMNKYLIKLPETSTNLNITYPDTEQILEILKSKNVYAPILEGENIYNIAYANQQYEFTNNYIPIYDPNFYSQTSYGRYQLLDNLKAFNKFKNLYKYNYLLIINSGTPYSNNPMSINDWSISTYIFENTIDVSQAIKNHWFNDKVIESEETTTTEISIENQKVTASLYTFKVKVKAEYNDFRSPVSRLIEGPEIEIYNSDYSNCNEVHCLKASRVVVFSFNNSIYIIPNVEDLEVIKSKNFRVLDINNVDDQNQLRNILLKDQY